MGLIFADPDSTSKKLSKTELSKKRFQQCFTIYAQCWWNFVRISQMFSGNGKLHGDLQTLLPNCAKIELKFSEISETKTIIHYSSHVFNSLPTCGYWLGPVPVCGRRRRSHRGAVIHEPPKMVYPSKNAAGWGFAYRIGPDLAGPNVPKNSTKWGETAAESLRKFGRR